jgi:hypothetical protein
VRQVTGALHRFEDQPSLMIGVCSSKRWSRSHRAGAGLGARQVRADGAIGLGGVLIEIISRPQLLHARSASPKRLAVGRVADGRIGHATHLTRHSEAFALGRSHWASSLEQPYVLSVDANPLLPTPDG